MKAVIMEIGKGYCIVLTRDGQFLKQEIPPGVFEVGEEIVVSNEYVFKKKRMDMSRVKTLSLAASIMVVMATVSFFGFWYMKHYNTARYTANLGSIYPAEEAGAPADADADAACEESITVYKEAAEEELAEEIPVSFEKVFYFDEQKEAEEYIGENLDFSYKIIDDTSIRVRLENIGSVAEFDGSLTFALYSSDDSESQTGTISINKLGPGDVMDKPIFLKAEEVKLKVQITGSLY
jgi:hypothetical protein